jgi:hypothetical protein
MLVRIWGKTGLLKDWIQKEQRLYGVIGDSRMSHYYLVSAFGSYWWSEGTKKWIIGSEREHNRPEKGFSSSKTYKSKKRALRSCMSLKNLGAIEINFLSITMKRGKRYINEYVYVGDK